MTDNPEDAKQSSEAATEPTVTTLFHLMKKLEKHTENLEERLSEFTTLYSNNHARQEAAFLGLHEEVLDVARQQHESLEVTNMCLRVISNQLRILANGAPAPPQNP